MSKAGQEWIKIWLNQQDFWVDKAVAVNKQGLEIYKRIIMRKNQGAIPEYRWKYAYTLDWDTQIGTFEREE